MSIYKRVNYTDVEPVAGAMHALGDSLDSERIGVSIVQCEPGWRNMPHDHATNGHEEIYILLEGRATVAIDDESIEMKSGDAVRIPPESTRQIRNEETESTFVLVSAPTSRRETSDADDVDSWLIDGFVG